MNTPSDIHPIFDRLVSRSQKERLLNQRAKVFWFTGLSGSGKSTIAAAIERRLFDMGYLVQMLDGDNIRTGISNNLGFSLADRDENIRRISEVTKLFLSSGIICLNTFVSPTSDIRRKAKDIIGEADYNLIYVKASVDLCESRDVKGLYAKARSGQIKGFTGIDSPFDEPENAALIIDTTDKTVDESVAETLSFILSKIQSK